MKRVLITGSEGFIGRHLVEKYRDAGWTVDGVDQSDAFGGFEEVITPFDTASEWDLVIHCAATVGGRAKIEGDPLAIASNLALDTELFRWALRAGKQAPRIVYFSSSAAYPIQLQTDVQWVPLSCRVADELWGPRDTRLQENDIDLSDAYEPDAMYGWVKLTGERLAAQAQREGLKVHVFRPFSGYGTDQSLDYPFPSFINRAKTYQNPFQIWGTGSARRDWIHVDDITEAVYKVVEEDRDAEAGPLNLCTGVDTSFLGLAEKVTYLNNYNPAVELLTDKPVGVAHRVGDPTKMNQFYTAKISLEEGIRRALVS